MIGVVPAPQLRIGYESAEPGDLLAQADVLAVLGFGALDPLSGAVPGWLRVGLAAPLQQPVSHEVWRSAGPVERGRDGAICWSQDAALLFGSIELEEEPAGGITAAAELAYARLLDFCAARGFPSLLRLWNYFDAITEGAGDRERYRLFSVGRARGMQTRLAQFPAATAIGRCDGQRRLQVYWLAAREPGEGIENPRQISAFRYPRQYGPQPPSFARATLPRSESMPLLISGTASIVGHASLHPGDLDAQLDETLRNLQAVLDAARERRPSLAPTLGRSSLLKAYVRSGELIAPVAARLHRDLPDMPAPLVLQAEVCRPELLVEIDGSHS